MRDAPGKPRPGRSAKCSRSIRLPRVVPRFLPSFSEVTPNDRGIQCICGVQVAWYSSYVHSVAFHIILALSKGTGSGTTLGGRIMDRLHLADLPGRGIPGAS